MPKTPPTPEDLEAAIEQEVLNQVVEVDKAIGAQVALKSTIEYVFPEGTRGEIIDRVNQMFEDAGWNTHPSTKDIRLHSYDDREDDRIRRIDRECAAIKRQEAEQVTDTSGPIVKRKPLSFSEWVAAVEYLSLHAAYKRVGEATAADVAEIAEGEKGFMALYPGDYFAWCSNGHRGWLSKVDGEMYFVERLRKLEQRIYQEYFEAMS